VNRVKTLKNKGIKPPEEIRLPELEIHGIWKRIINWIGHIRHLYWIMSITAFLVLFLTLTPHHTWIVLWSSLKVHGTLVGMVLIFTLVAVSLVWSTGQYIDVWVFMYFNMHGRRAPWLDWLMLGFTQIGSGIFAIALAFILFLQGNHLLAYELALGSLTLWLVVELMKVIIHRTRPYIKLDSIRIVGSRARGQSFPSGHTSQTFFMVALFLHYYQVGVFVSLGLYAIALLVGITRIYVGMHYPRDVLGGAILGSAWGILGVIVNNYLGIIR
jgi:membrane-associated phospholipid phosphatase